MYFLYKSIFVTLENGENIYVNQLVMPQMPPQRKAGFPVMLRQFDK